MPKIMIKPLSANEAWKGRRFKSEKYSAFERDVYYLLPKRIEIPEGKLQIKFVFGLSNKNADGDNCMKQMQDIIAACYKFNDKRIYKWNVEKVDVVKGNEFIDFEIKALESGQKA